MKKSATWKWLAKAFLFVFINLFSAAIFLVALTFIHPDFEHGFLTGKAALFDGFWFPAGLYIHSFTAPVALFLVSLLVIFRIERQVALHRFLGKVTLLLLLFAVVPSGWILSGFAMGGSAGKFTFFVLSSYTAFAAFRGYTSIRSNDLFNHRFWMIEVLLLLSSAIILRLLLALFQREFQWFGDTAYCTAAIASWVPSVIVLKIIRLRREKSINNTEATS